MSGRASKGLQPATAAVHLPDGNVLYALVDQAHVHHAAAQALFVGQAKSQTGFATCPITLSMLLRLTLRVGGYSIEQGLAVLAQVTQHKLHQSWPDKLA